MAGGGGLDVLPDSSAAPPSVFCLIPSCAGSSCVGKGWTKSSLFVGLLSRIPTPSKPEPGQGGGGADPGAESPCGHRDT